MAIFTSDNKQLNGKGGGAATIIAVGTYIRGEVDTSCHFHVDGEFEGVIQSKNTVMVGKTGLVKGDIFAQKLIVSGKLIGNAHCNRIEIAPYGRLEGVIKTDELTIERKGVFVGESKSSSELKLVERKTTHIEKDDPHRR